MGKWSEHVLHRFTGGLDGGDPVRGLIFDADGNLYGTTTDFCDILCGVVYEITPQPIFYVLSSDHRD